ncbi:MAG: hypothetical protein ACR2K6_04050 [Solirubrobacterales bacterium]
MSVVSITALAVVVLILFLVGYGSDLRRLAIRARAKLTAPPEPVDPYVLDPGRELRAERRAEALLRSVVGEEGWEAYRALGFLHIFGSTEGGESYGYLIYPHRPIVSFDTRTGRLLSELCVTFPDRSDPALGERLPDADDVLAKWMALRGDERGLISRANMHMPGRQVDPSQARRDVARLSEWTDRTGEQLSPSHD